MRARCTVLAGATAAALLGPSPGLADPPGTVRLAWVRAEGADACPGPAALSQQITQQLGRDPFAPDAARTLEVVVAREPARWLARIYVRGPDGALVGSREITSEEPDCEALGSSVVLAAVLAIDPDAASRPVAPARPTPAAQPPPAPAPAPPTRPTPQRVPGRRRVTRRAPRAAATIVVQLVGNLGLQPAPSLGFAVATDGPIYARLRWSAGVVVFPETRTVERPALFGFGLAAARVSGCWDVARDPRLALAACGGLAAGVLYTVVHSPQPTSPGDRPWAGATASVRFAVTLAGPLVAEVGLEAIAPFVRQRFLVEGRADAVFQQSPVAGAAHLGLGAHF